MSAELDVAILMIEAHAVRELAKVYKGTSTEPQWSPAELFESLTRYADGKAYEARRAVALEATEDVSR